MRFGLRYTFVMRQILLASVLAVLFSSLSLAGETNSMRSAQEVLPGRFTEKLPLRFQLPADFVVRDVDDDFKGLDGAGILWGTATTG